MTAMKKLLKEKRKKKESLDEIPCVRATLFQEARDLQKEKG